MAATEAPVRVGEERAERASVMPRAAQIAGRVLYATLLFALFMTPFEIGYPPLGRILWTTYTNLEAALFLVGGAWVVVMAVDGEARRRFLRLPLFLPAGALVGAMVLSTVLGEYRSMGVQSIYRLLMGVLMMAAGWEALRSTRRLVGALLVTAGAAGLSAIFGLLEYAPWIDIEPWLRIFKPQSTTAGGMLRLSGTFEYANGAAAYFELVLPLVMGLILVFSVRAAFGEVRQRWASVGRAVQVGLYVVLGLCVMALLLTFSRAAWVGVGIALGVVGLGLWVRGRALGAGGFRAAPMWGALGLGVVVMALGLMWVFSTQPLFRLRMLGENDREWYRNSISAGEIPTLTESAFVTVPVTVRNDGPIVWRAKRPPVVNLSYHWREPGKPNYTIFEGVRTSLPYDLAPGESVTVQAMVWAPSKAGTYALEWDMVQENVTWFYQKSKSRGEAMLYTVNPAPAGAKVVAPPPSDYGPVNIEETENYDSSAVPRRQLWSVAWKMFTAHPITGVGPDGFRNLYGPYAGTNLWNRNIYTNSTYVEMFTNLGIVGGAAFLWLVGLALWRAVRGVLRMPVGGRWLISLGATASLVAFLVHGAVDYFLFSTPLYVTFWLVLGVAMPVDEERSVSGEGRKGEVRERARGKKTMGGANADRI